MCVFHRQTDRQKKNTGQKLDFPESIDSGDKITCFIPDKIGIKPLRENTTSVDGTEQLVWLESTN